jgi:eRF1 domain 2
MLLGQVAETATQIFITGGDRANVAGLVLAGSAEFKNELSESDIFDPRLKAIVLAVVDVSYGMCILYHLGRVLHMSCHPHVSLESVHNWSTVRSVGLLGKEKES